MDIRQPLLHDEITELGHSDEHVDDQQPSCSYETRQNHLSPLDAAAAIAHAAVVGSSHLADAPIVEEEGGEFPGLLVTYQGQGGASNSNNQAGLPGSVSEDDSGVSTPREELIVYPSRWYILCSFFCLNFMQGNLTLSNNVIAPSVKAAFGWDAQTLAFIQSWLYTTYLVTVWPFLWLMEKKGLRIAMLAASCLLVLATAMRCVTAEPPGVTWCTHIAHIMVGASAPVIFTAGPVLSSAWFPPHERTTATAVMTVAGFAGSAFSFIIGPLSIDSPINSTIPSVDHPTNYTNIPEIREQILHLRYGEFAVCAVLFLTICVYFPRKPPSPPTLSAATQKMSFFEGFKALFLNKKFRNFWWVAITYGLSTSMYAVWSGLMDVNFESMGVTEMEAGWMGFASVMAGCVFAVILGIIADILLQGHMKNVTVVCVVLSIVSTIFVVVIAQNWWHIGLVGLSCFIVAQGIFNNAPIALFYEMAIESAFPIPEEITSGMMSVVFNLFPNIFLIIFQVPHIGVWWMNWVLLGSFVLCFPMMIAFTEKYRRLAVDNHENPETEDLDDPAAIENKDPESAPVVQNRPADYGSINT